MPTDLTRFIDAQNKNYDRALAEIRSGKKQSHWIWYIFPQYKGLGFSATSKFYAIQHLDEARAYLNHPVLGLRLKEVSNELLQLNELDAHQIFGSPDDLKVKSCMTLFSLVDDSDEKLFLKVLDNYFGSELDTKTVSLTKNE